MLLCQEEESARPCSKVDCMCKFTYDYSSPQKQCSAFPVAVGYDDDASFIVADKLLDPSAGDLSLKNFQESPLKPIIYEKALQSFDLPDDEQFLASLNAKNNKRLDDELVHHNFQDSTLNNPEKLLANVKLFACLNPREGEFLDVELLDNTSFLQLNCGKKGTDESEFIYEEASLFLTAQELVLRQCNQTQPLPFVECYPKSLLQNCQKIGEGIYGEVFLYKNEAREPTVIKVIPIEGHQMINGQLQQSYQNVLTEINIAKKLSNLRYNRLNQTSGFIKVSEIHCVQGKYPEELLDLWELYDETRGSQNDSPEIFKDDQLYIVLETRYGGSDLESFVFDDALQAYSIFVQVAWTLAVAEAELKFEHRDLHWGNILVTRVPKEKTIKFILNGAEIEIKSYGVEASIIDFNMSRVECSGGVVIFCDIGQDLSYFNATGDYQFEIYKLMQQKNGNEWRHFEPYTNILWLSYLLDKAITSLRYKKGGKKHKEYVSKMKELNLEILGYDSTKDFAVHYLLKNYI